MYVCMYSSPTTGEISGSRLDELNDYDVYEYSFISLSIFCHLVLQIDRFYTYSLRKDALGFNYIYSELQSGHTHIVYG